MTRLLFSDEYAEITADDASRILAYRRKAKAIESKEALDRFFRGLGSSEGFGDRGRWRLLVDVRQAPSRNDDEFESIFRKHRDKMFGGFERRAVLVKSASGALQIQRLAREAHDGNERVFDDETEARAWLLAGKRRE
jgi:hypothetical protein